MRVTMSKDKIKTWEEIGILACQLTKEMKKVVFTNGCFDILHAGHAQYLEEAKALGDILIVGLNSDHSVRRLKGESRPIISQEDRALLLAAIECVDYVVIFDQDTPLNLIKLIQPDVLVKGGDWKVADIVGSETVLAKGGEVFSLPFRDGISTSNIISRIAAMASTKVHKD